MDGSWRVRRALPAFLLLAACTQPVGSGAVPGASPTPVAPKGPVASAAPTMAPVGAALERLEVTVDGAPLAIENAGSFVVTKNVARWTIGRAGWYLDWGVVFDADPLAGKVTIANAKSLSLALNPVGGSGGWLASRAARGDDDTQLTVADGLVTLVFDGTMSDPSSGRTAQVKATLAGRLR